METLATYARRSQSGAIAASVACLIVSGCAQARFYQATQLPPEFVTPPVENVQTVDLSRLVTASVSNELVERGDLLEVSIETGYGEDHANALLVRVGEDGIATIPLVGKVPLADLKVEGAEQAIAAAAIHRNVFRNPTVTVAMKQRRVSKVTVIGAVENPGVYDLPRGSSSLLSAIVAAGGLNAKAGMAVEIRRPATAHGRQDHPIDQVTAAGFRQPQSTAQPISYHVDLNEATRQGRISHDLEDGDIVMVQTRDPQPFDVIGLVTKPGRFELPANKDLYLLDALALAGGTSSSWADKVHVTRQVASDSEPIVVEVSIKEAKRQGKGNLRLAPGDVVSVEMTATTTITGAVRSVAPYSLTAIIPFIR